MMKKFCFLLILLSFSNYVASACFWSDLQYEASQEIEVDCKVNYLLHLKENKIVIGSDCGLIKIYDLDNPAQCLLMQKQHQFPIVKLTNLENDRFSSLDQGGNLIIWDVFNLSYVRFVKLPTDSQFIDMLYLGSDKLISHEKSGVLKVWHIYLDRSPFCLWENDNFFGHTLTKLSSNMFAAILTDGTICISDINSKATYALPSDQLKYNIIDILPMHENLIACGCKSGDVMVLDISNTENPLVEIAKQHKSMVTSMVKLSDNIFVSGTYTGEIAFWDISNSENVLISNVIVDSDAPVGDLLYLGNYVMLSRQYDKIIFWDIADLSKPRCFACIKQKVVHLDFHNWLTTNSLAINKKIIAGMNDKILIWNYEKELPFLYAM